MLNIYIHTHTFDKPISGADIYMIRVCQFLLTKGCKITAGIDNCQKDYVQDGINITSNSRLLGECYDGADVILSHLLWKSYEQGALSERFRKPVFFLVNNDSTTGLMPGNDRYMIYNSQALNGRHKNFESIVVTPPTFYEDWRNDIDHYNNLYITLVNCTQNKGVETAYSLAQHMPKQQFLFVTGGYGAQFRKVSPNLRYMPYQTDMRKVYDITRILLVPSKTESWSLVAAEAQASGIPVICSDLPGLRENLGNCADYASSVKGFIDAITMLNIPHRYQQRVFESVANARTKPHLQELENLYEFMVSKIKNKVTVIKESKEEFDTEKVIIPDTREKVLHEPVKEKKIINKPTTTTNAH